MLTYVATLTYLKIEGHDEMVMLGVFSDQKIAYDICHQRAGKRLSWIPGDINRIHQAEDDENGLYQIFVCPLDTQVSILGSVG